MIRTALAVTLLAIASAEWGTPPAAAQAVPGEPHWRWQNPLPTGYYMADLPTGTYSLRAVLNTGEVVNRTVQVQH